MHDVSADTSAQRHAAHASCDVRHAGVNTRRGDPHRLDPLSVLVPQHPPTCAGIPLSADADGSGLIHCHTTMALVARPPRLAATRSVSSGTPLRPPVCRRCSQYRRRRRQRPQPSMPSDPRTGRQRTACCRSPKPTGSGHSPAERFGSGSFVDRRSRGRNDGERAGACHRATTSRADAGGAPPAGCAGSWHTRVTPVQVKRSPRRGSAEPKENTTW
jgi:hypothetical protein